MTEQSILDQIQKLLYEYSIITNTDCHLTIDQRPKRDTSDDSSTDLYRYMCKYEKPADNTIDDAIRSSKYKTVHLNSVLRLADDDLLEIEVQQLYDNFESTRSACFQRFENGPYRLDKSWKADLEVYDSKNKQQIELLKRMFPCDTIISYSELKKKLEKESVKEQDVYELNEQDMNIWHFDFYDGGGYVEDYVLLRVKRHLHNEKPIACNV